MRSVIKTLLLAALILGGTEAVAYWWMHPAPSGLDEPVLVYRLGDRKQDTQDTGGSGQETEGSKIQDSKSNIQNLTPQSVTLLPDVVASSIPSLHCSTGTAARIDRDDGVTIHLAFFEWNLADSTNVLEAYKHLPEECMGSIGMKLISKENPIVYTVRKQGEGFSGDGVLPQSGEITFDHTVFRDPSGVVVHAFKGTWVSGANTLLGDGLRGGGAQARLIRWKSALKRFHPAYARVAQGAVRGITNSDQAWQAFEDAMLVDLRMERE